MARKTDQTKQRANTSNTPRKTAKQWVEEGNTHFAEAEEAQERLAQLREEGYGDDDDDDYSIGELVDLIHWSGQFLEEHK